MMLACALSLVTRSLNRLRTAEFAASDDAFIYATLPRPHDRFRNGYPSEVGDFSGDPSAFELFVREGEGVRLASTSEIQTHFESRIGTPKARSWKELPRAESMRWVQDGDTKILELRRGAETQRIDFFRDPKLGANSTQISDDEMAGLVRQLPWKAVQTLKRVELRPSHPWAAGQFDFNAGTMPLFRS